MIVTGAEIFYSFKDRLSKMNKIRDEYNNKVQIRIDNDLIFYTHICEEKDGTIVI